MPDLSVDQRRVAPLPGATVRNVIASASGQVGDLVRIAPDYGARPAIADVAEDSIVLGIVTAIGCEGALNYIAGDALSVVFSGPVCGVKAAGAGLVFLSNTPGKLSDTAGTVRRVAGQMIHADIFLVAPVNS